MGLTARLRGLLAIGAVLHGWLADNAGPMLLNRSNKTSTY